MAHFGTENFLLGGNSQFAAADSSFVHAGPRVSARALCVHAKSSRTPPASWEPRTNRSFESFLATAMQVSSLTPGYQFDNHADLVMGCMNMRAILIWCPTSAKMARDYALSTLSYVWSAGTFYCASKSEHQVFVAQHLTQLRAIFCVREWP